MVFSAMSQEAIKEFVEWCFDHNNNALIITLVDGTTICGFISGHYSSFSFKDNIEKEAKAQDCCYTDKEVILQDTRQHLEKEYYIPFEKIAGITAFAFSQESFKINDGKFPFDLDGFNQEDKKGYDRNKKQKEYEARLDIEGKYHTPISIKDILLDDLYDRCTELGFSIKQQYFLYFGVSSRPFAWGELKPETEYPMYADWEYISNLSGGINSIGAGIMVASASTSWQRSLYSFRKKLMNKHSQEIISIKKGDTGDIVINAYIDHVYVKTGKKKTIPYETLEGERWFPVILSEVPIKENDDLQSGKWCIGYMREKCMLVPKPAFEVTQYPLRIQGEIVPMTLKTSFGDSKFVIKIRNISYIPKTTEK